jgi:hypothetical protein
MPRSCSVSSKRESVMLSDAELDFARELVIKILALVQSDPQRFKLFLTKTSLGPQSVQDLAQSPLFMLSTLDAATQDQELVAALESDAQVTKPLIEMTQASLAFHIAAELTRQGGGRTPYPDVGERARQKLRELSEESHAEKEIKKTAPGRGEI